MEIAYHAAIEMKTGILFYSLISVSSKFFFLKEKNSSISLFKITTKLTIIRKFGVFFQYGLAMLILKRMEL